MRRHGSWLALLMAAALVAALLALHVKRPAPAAVHAPVRAAARGGIAVVDGAVKIDLNRADEALLMELPGVGPALAEAIIAGRPYGAVEDLLRVKGIGEAKLAALRDRVTVPQTP